MGYTKVTKEAIDLTEEFVQDNFTQGYLDNLKQNARKANGIFIEIPAGESREHESQDQNNAYPKLHYRQIPGENTCLMISVANLLYEHVACKHASFLVND